MSTIVIPIEVVPDLTIISEYRKTYSGNTAQKKSFIFSHNLCVVEEIDEAGEKARYIDLKYTACRLFEGKVQVISEKYGWLTDLDATKCYFDKVAETELLK